ncbi:sugar phosphate isomerase/epimerase [Candidatus Pelagibacter sp.]|nr:sugar phosphate isomerase/epimerase [Candidatus Pelagibacter sp.]
MDTFLSTGGFNKKKPSEIIKILKKNKIFNIELSGGKYEKNLTKKILNFNHKTKIMIHNYFPYYKDNFVFNLSSQNKKIVKKSINLAKAGIRINSKLRNGFYAFHAGFLFDPAINMLGDKPVPSIVIDRKKALSSFIKNVKILAKYAKKKNVTLLIENNVVSSNQYSKYNYKPLMCDTIETSYIMKNTPKNVFILLDFGHLKVSSSTLSFSKSKYISKLNKYILAYHLSENKSKSDDNLEFTNNSWFWKYIKKNAKYCSVEVYDKKINKLKNLIKLVDRKINL